MTYKFNVIDSIDEIPLGIKIYMSALPAELEIRDIPKIKGLVKNSRYTDINLEDIITAKVISKNFEDWIRIEYKIDESIYTIFISSRLKLAMGVNYEIVKKLNSYINKK